MQILIVLALLVIFIYILAACESSVQTSTNLKYSDQISMSSISMDRWFSTQDAIVSYDQWFTDLSSADVGSDLERTEIKDTQLWTWIDDYDHERSTRQYQYKPYKVKVDVWT